MTKIRRLIHSSLDDCAKETPIMAFIQHTNLGNFSEDNHSTDAFITFARKVQTHEI
ncbi:hypothetical protein PT286_00165 [Neisseriaceae bacterium ESL0693]|nr:hypothetical protein [Neisseriaceae bacterium ESL0693]